ncbi:unnamed protein product, partial [Symbiodinium sp. CCMP2456]
MVKRLERLVVDESENEVDRLCAGFFWVCIYLRARYSDAQGLKNLSVDEPEFFAGPLAGYFEGETSRTKTSFSLERKTALLPMVGPLFGVAGVPWFKTWVSLREDLGVPAGEEFPLLPGRGLEGGWDSMMFVYGRDNVAPALRTLEGLLADVRIGKFIPDATRSRYFPNEPERVPGDEIYLEVSPSEASMDEEDNVPDLRAEESAADVLVPPWSELLVEEPAQVWKEECDCAASVAAGLEQLGLVWYRIHSVFIARPWGGQRSAVFELVTAALKKRADALGLFAEGLAEVLDSVVGAMAITESKANFSSRAKALGLEDAVLAKFVGEGIDCMSKFAFLSSFVPGNTDEKPFTDAVAKVQVERTDDSAPRKLAAPDRADRLQRQQQCLVGLNIHGPTLPGHAVIDKCVQMYEGNVLHYLPPQACPCRDDEVKFKKDRDDKMLSVDGTGHVSLKSHTAKVEADVTTDLLLKRALTRRGLALDQAGVVSFSEHERWVEALFNARFREPPDNYMRVTLQQLMQADRQLFVEAADRTRQGIQLVADGKPVDKIWSDAMSCNNVTHLLQPLPAPPPAPVHPRHGPYDDRRGNKGKGKGKGKGKVQGNVRMPAELADGVPVTTRGLAICFDHNLGRCQRPVSNGKCDKGLHICCIKGCFKRDHTYANCRPDGDALLSCATKTDSPISAEQFASNWLKTDWLCQTDILKLFDMLPQVDPPRGTQGGKPFATGAFAKVKVGLRSNLAVFPQASAVLATLVRQSAPAHKFTSLVVFDGTDISPSYIPNLVVPVSDFKDGAIWVESSSGKVSRNVDGKPVQGLTLPVSEGPVLFDARRSVHLTVADNERFRVDAHRPVRLPWPPRFPVLTGSPPFAQVPLDSRDVSRKQ